MDSRNVNSCHIELYKTKMRINGSHSERSYCESASPGYTLPFWRIERGKHQRNMEHPDPCKQYRKTITKRPSEDVWRSYSTGRTATNGMDSGFVYQILAFFLYLRLRGQYCLLRLYALTPTYRFTKLPSDNPIQILRDLYVFIYRNNHPLNCYRKKTFLFFTE